MLTNYEKAKSAKRGRYLWDKETSKFIHESEYFQKNPPKPIGKAPMVFCNHFTPYRSMVTGQVIENKQQHLYDLHSTGSRVYEGREIEQQEADRYKQHKEEKLWQNVGETLEKTYHDIEHGYITPKEPEPGQAAPAENWEF